MKGQNITIAKFSSFHITGPGEISRNVFNFTFPEPVCPECHPSCIESCWGEGAHNCQKFNKINCSSECEGGRCFGSNPSDCCHPFCAVGCTGPTQTECLACRHFDDDGLCRHQCPPIERYNLNSSQWEPNPKGKYAHKHKCLKNCPKNLLNENGVCVSSCSVGKMAKDNDCVICNGPCPKTCPGVGVVNSGNIDSYRGCVIIAGTLEILDQTFNGYPDVYSNFSIGPMFKKMHPDRLEVFSTLREVTGFINIQGDHADFTNLSYFRNLEVIGGRQLFGLYSASLYIIKTNLKSLELRSLRQINSGTVMIVENKNLCFANEIDWTKIKKPDNYGIMIANNTDPNKCSKYIFCFGFDLIQRKISNTIIIFMNLVNK